MAALNVLILTDTHHIGIADHICRLKERKSTMALELIQKVHRSVPENEIDLILLLGDLVDNGNADGAEKDIKALQEALEKFKKPVFVAPGNHDVNPQTVFEIFNDHEGFHEIAGYQFISFADTYNKDNTADRSWMKMEEAFAKADPSKPIIVLQHNPVYPPISEGYPYNINQSDAIVKYYSEKGVVLSVSGHAHWGIPAAEKDNVSYLTCPALCEGTFRYIILTLNGRKFAVREFEAGDSKNL